MPFTKTALMMTPEAGVYHLNLRPEELAPTILLVGDPQRVKLVAQYFDRIEVEKAHREFVSCTGYIGKTRLTVLSTGIGVDNIDIVLNELDALVNIDFATGQIKQQLTELNIFRLGTAGSLQADIPVDSIVVSDYAIGFDGLMSFYEIKPTLEEQKLQQAVMQHFHQFPISALSYSASADPTLKNLFTEPKFHHGITLTMMGFYGPQRRQLRAPLASQNLLNSATTFNFNHESISNFEMETAAIYSLGKLLGHRCCSLSAIVANRILETTSHNPQTAIKQMIAAVLEQLLKGR